jgi:hypothetical protein
VDCKDRAVLVEFMGDPALLNARFSIKLLKHLGE